jgi:hypothetical protein
MIRYIDKTPCNCFLLEISPNDLRKIADRLDAQLKIAYPGQTVLLPISDLHTISFTVPYTAGVSRIFESED